MAEQSEHTEREEPDVLRIPSDVLEWLVLPRLRSSHVRDLGRCGGVAWLAFLAAQWLHSIIVRKKHRMGEIEYTKKEEVLRIPSDVWQWLVHCPACAPLRFVRWGAAGALPGWPSWQNSGCAQLQYCLLRLVTILLLVLRRLGVPRNT